MYIEIERERENMKKISTEYKKIYIEYKYRIEYLYIEYV